ncbi:MAG: diaminopimelate decarboxylase [Chloroflexi bacterium]|nr:diaminopimelate decarboxylase [Chloroflexota bacterium]
MTQLPLADVLPISASVNDAGRLAINGLDVRDIVEEFGSPLYLFDESTIREMCREFVGNFRRHYPKTDIEYSTKAMSNPAILKIIEQEGLHIDVVTGGELAFALAANFPAEKINFHGNNKVRSELREAVEAGIGRITIDSFHEIELLNEVAGELGTTQDVNLRVSPSIDPHTHRLTSTGVLDSKFGFSIETGDAEKAVAAALAQPNLDVQGLHFHLGSPLFELEPYEEAIEYVCAFAARMKWVHHLELNEFSPGGGMAIGYLSSKLPPTIAEYAQTISESLVSACTKYGLDQPRMIIEPGRSIVGRAGVAVYSVGGIKRIPGVRTYVSVDGGMGDNIRPALYEAEYEVMSVDDPLGEPTQKVTIAGKFCESGDLLAKDVELPDVKTDDLLALPASGAYCVPMASNYNLQTRPAIVLVTEQSEARLIRRRETYADLLATAIFE